MNWGINKVLNWFSNCYVSKFFKREHCKHDLSVAFVVGKIVVLLLFISSLNTFGQTTIWSEDFESYSDGTQQGSGTPPKWTITPTSGYSNYFEVQNNLFEGRNMNQEGIFTSESIYISSFSSIVVSVDVSEQGSSESSDYVKLYYKIDGGTETFFETNGDNSGNFGSATSTTDQLNGNSLVIIIKVLNSSDNERHRFDNILVQGTLTDPPSCTTPISPTDGETGFAVDGSLTWNSVAGASGYYLYFGTDASATNIENGTDLGNITSYTPASNLNFSTNYYWKIIPHNGIGSATSCSVWQFTTEDVSYCSTSGTMSWATSITLVSFNTINNITAKPAGYNDYTLLSTDLMKGNSYNLTINLNTDGNYTSHAMVWIDWNQDGDFADSGEDYDMGNVTNVTDGATSNSPLSVTVPGTAALGSTRMRVSTKYNSYPTSCETSFDGEVEDYTINIQAIGPNLSVSPSGLDFGNVCVDATAGPESFTITGSLLTTADVTVTALNGYTISTTAGGTYSASLTLSQAGGNYSQVIYVKFAPTAAAGYNGNIVIGGGGASNVNVAVTGSGTDFSIPLTANTNTVDCPNSTNGSIDLSVPYPIQFNDPDYIDIDSTLLSNRTAFTLEGWIKVDLADIGSRISIFGQNDAIELGFTNSNTLVCWTSSGGSVSTGVYPSDNDWHHVAAVGNGTSIIIYIDGNLVSTGGSTTTNYGNDTNFSSKIGAGVWDPTGGYYPGQMIKAGFWSTALSAGEISNLASTYYNYTGFETGLLAGYNFFEGTGTTLGSATAETDGSFNDTPTWLDDYTFLWTKSGDAGFSETTQDLSGVEPGTYNVEVTNSSVACSNSGSWTINHADTEDPTITCPANVTVNPDDGLCTATGVALGTPTTADNCGVASVTNNSSEPFAFGITTVTWTVADDAGNTATCQQTVTVEPTEIIDIEVVDLGNSCQSGETGSGTTITWDVNLIAGTNSWTYDYKINDGTTDVKSGTNESATGDIQISYPMDNQTATDKTYTITLTNVKDNCGVDETNTGNNSDAATMFGVPDTSDIITN